ncbi:MAG TPA: hypothetical protein VEL03_00115 [Streptosporangiaceae bacterium]|nr:hypothetical protein [Streptosporangiaceae bacterium]
MPELDDMIGQRFGRLAGEELPVPPTAAVVRRGRQRRQRARGKAAAAVAAAVVIALGVTQLARSAARTPQVTTPHHRGHQSAGLCTAAPSSELRRELAGQPLPLSSQTAVTPIALSRDGTVIYVQTTVPGFRGIASESLATGDVLTDIQALPQDYSGPQGGLGPAGELIWTNSYSTHGGESYGLTQVRYWSPRAGKVTVTALEPAGQTGDALSGPVFAEPGNKLAAWEQADGSTQEIVEANLVTGAVDVIARGRLGPPVFVGTALVWPVADNPSGQPSHLVAMNAGLFPASQQITVPRALRAAGDGVLMGSGPAGSWPLPISLIASNGTATAYFSTNLTELFYSPSPSQPARLVLRLAGNNFEAGPPVLGDGYLGWTTDSAAIFLASTSSFAAVQVASGGSLFGAGDDVLVGQAQPPKTSRRAEWHLVSTSAIATLQCASTAAGSRP